jgi:hypothetical protein
VDAWASGALPAAQWGGAARIFSVLNFAAPPRKLAANCQQLVAHS